MQEIEIDFEALDAAWIPGMEFAFFNTLAAIDPFQPLTISERNEIMVTRYGATDGCGTWMHLNCVADRINDYWSADDSANEEIVEDAIAALTTLGFKLAPSKKAVADAVEGGATTLEAIIKASLRRV